MAVRSVPSSDQGQKGIPVPRLVTDPIASLRPAAVNVQAAGHMMEIPPLVAADWLQVLMVGESLSLDDVFPGMLDPDDREIIEDALFNGYLELEAMYEMSLEAISLTAGRPWWIALRLIELARTNWDVLGAELVLKGIDANQLSLSAWLDAVMLTTLRNMEQSKITMFLMQLEQAPKTVEQEEATMDRNQFFAMM